MRNASQATMKRATVSSRDLPGSARVARIEAVFDAFRSAAGAGLGITDLTRRTGLPKATVYRLVNELAAVGLLERCGSGWRIGMKMFELGQLAPLQNSFRDTAADVPLELRERTQMTVNLAVMSGSDVLYLEILRGPKVPKPPTRVGGRWPLHATGLGKALLAFGGEQVIEGLLVSGLRRVGPRTITAPGLLARELARVRDDGAAFDREESACGLTCVASPVFAPDGAVAALSVSGWSAAFNHRRCAAQVSNAARLVTRSLAKYDLLEKNLAR